MLTLYVHRFIVSFLCLYQDCCTTFDVHVSLMYVTTKEKKQNLEDKIISYTLHPHTHTSFHIYPVHLFPVCLSLLSHLLLPLWSHTYIGLTLKA